MCSVHNNKHNCTKISIRNQLFERKLTNISSRIILQTYRSAYQTDSTAGVMSL